MVIVIFRRVIMDIVMFLPVNVAHPGTLLLIRVGLESCLSGSLVPANILAVPDVVLAPPSNDLRVTVPLAPPAPSVAQAPPAPD